MWCMLQPTFKAHRDPGLPLQGAAGCVEIDKLEFIAVERHQNVVRFQIAVHNVLLMQVIHGLHQLQEQLSHRSRREKLVSHTTHHLKSIPKTCSSYPCATTFRCRVSDHHACKTSETKGPRSLTLTDRSFSASVHTQSKQRERPQKQRPSKEPTTAKAKPNSRQSNGCGVMNEIPLFDEFIQLRGGRHSNCFVSDPVAVR